MLNQVILVGKTSDIAPNDEGAVVTLITDQKVYGKDEIERNELELTVPNPLWTNMRELIKPDMVVGLKARLKNNGKLLVVVEKVTVMNNRIVD